MIKRIITDYYGNEEILLYPLEINPTKLINTNTTIATARNTLAVGHRFRGDLGEVM